MNGHNLSTSNFKKNIVFAGKLLLMLLLVLGFFLHLSPQYLGNYQASLLDKMERLKSIEGPKIVLIGNSNLAFGMDSEELEQAFGLPVVNMGLNGGMGNAFHERMALTNVTEGDIYIVCHSEYSDDGTILDVDLTWITIENHFDLWKLVGKNDWKAMFAAYPAYLKRCLSLWLTNTGNRDDHHVYCRSAFNAYGDIEWDDQGETFDFGEGSVQLPKMADVTTQRLNRLSADLQERGATLLVAGYPIADTPDRPSDEEIAAYARQLSEKLDAPVISDFRDYIFPEEYFFNTALHLTNTGKRARTRQLIYDLQNYHDGLGRATHKAAG